MSKRLNLIGEKFNRWTVLEFAYIKNRNSYWKCVCVCGVKRDIVGYNLKSGFSKSCGCLNTEKRKERMLGEDNPNYGKYKEDNPNYNSNLTDKDRIDRRYVIGYKEWRKCVYEVDDYICQKCGDSPSNNLNAHHIEAYRSNPNLRTEVSNGITLCKECHKDFHHQYGYGNNTKVQLIEFLVGGLNNE